MDFQAKRSGTVLSSFMKFVVSHDVAQHLQNGAPLPAVAAQYSGE